MTLSPGTRLGRYEIRSLLGAGGMGEVYLAEDTRLERRVALKILPAGVAQNAERMRRFVREAKAASALNHPNIAHIYEIGEGEGANFIAMEFVEGVSLREKIHRERADSRTLLKYLTQVAEGLAKAHAAGIVHRDLKPDNVMVSADGYAKILDFGLAKLVEPQSPPGVSAEELNEAATAVLPPPLSTPGMIMGTVGYMSPEQAQGRREVDQRSDIFSFGCILYEAATGRQPFAGETAVDSLHKIIHAQPPPIKEFNAGAPADLQRVVRRCLRKDPEERYQSIKDVAIELRELRREMEGAADIDSSVAPSAQSGMGGTAHVGAQPSSSAVAGRASQTKDLSAARSTSSAEYIVSEIKWHRRGAAVVLALLALALAGAGYGIYKWTASRDKPWLSFASAKITRLTTTGKASNAAISPDGRYVVHVEDEGGRQSLWMRQTAAQSSVQIVAPAEVTYNSLTFSPDGDYIYYNVTSQEYPNGALLQVPTLGGTPKKILENLDIDTISFSPDGRQFAFIRFERGKEAALMIADADGGNQRKLVAHRNPPDAIGYPAWSPEGKRIVYEVTNYGSNDATVFEAQVADGSTRPLTAQRWFRVVGLSWMSDGDSLLMLATAGQSFVYQIWQLSYPEGEARRLTNDLDDYQWMSLTADSKTLAVVKQVTQANVWAAPVGDAARARPVTSGSGKADYNVAWTPDGRIVYTSNAGGNDDIWITGADGGNPKQLTSNARINRNPVASPDGRHIVFLSDRSGIPHLWRMNIDGSDQRQLTDTGLNGEAAPQFSPDGRWLFYMTAHGRRSVWKILADGSGEPLKLSDKFSTYPSVSPDGKLVAYFYRDENAPWRIAVASPEGGEPLKTFALPATSSHPLRWTPDGRAVAYIDTKNGVSNIVAQPLDGGPPKQITNFTSDRIFWFDISRDGRQFALSRGTQTSDVVLIRDFR